MVHTGERDVDGEAAGRFVGLAEVSTGYPAECFRMKKQRIKSIYLSPHIERIGYNKRAVGKVYGIPVATMKSRKEMWVLRKQALRKQWMLHGFKAAGVVVTFFLALTGYMPRSKLIRIRRWILTAYLERISWRFMKKRAAKAMTRD
ncbi:MAG: hypothetical protein IIZ39_12025 [Blautia sp.]|nr:hypothetical protein [Blautia sp.]